MTAAPKKNRTLLYVVIAFAVLGSCVPCIGIVSAIAIPSFVSYVRRSKAIEARVNLRMLAMDVASAYETERVRPDGSTYRSLPASLPRTPATVGPARQTWPATADPRWASELSWAPADPLYYAYEYVEEPGGQSFVVRAYGDLDGDGVESTFELRGTVDPTTGEVSYPPEPLVTNELE